jgi:hypothetical protein
MENTEGLPGSWSSFALLTDFFTSSGPWAILSIISGSARATTEARWEDQY